MRRLFRDPASGQLVRDIEGDEAAQAEALALATDHSAEFLATLRRHLATVDEFGGSVFIAASRVKFDRDGEVVEHEAPFPYVTQGWVFDYDKKSRLRGQPDEADSSLATAEPEPIDAPEPNGHRDEPVPIPVE